MEKELPNYILIRSNIKNVYLHIKDGQLIVKAPNKINKKEIDKIVLKKAKWIDNNLKKAKVKQEKEDLYTKEEFIQIIKDTVKDMSNLTGLYPQKCTIKDIKYAWGSCSSKKNISINSNLIKYSRQAIQYVVLHELCHIKYMNHSKDFWNLVEKYMPNYKEVKKEFK